MKEFRKNYIGAIPGAEHVFPISPWIQFASKDSTKLHTYFFPSRNQNPTACVIMFHGFTGYADLSTFIVNCIADHCHVLAMDQRGSGRSGGQRILINNFQSLVQDSVDFTLLVYRQFNLPIFLHGQSMGGAISIHVAAQLRELIKGIILQAPAILHSNPRNNFLSCIFYCIGCCCPCLHMGDRMGDNLSNITRNQYATQYVLQDELMYKGKPKARTLKSLVSGMRKASRLAGEIECGVLIFFGTDDRVTSLESAREFLTRVRNKDKRLVEIPDARHFLMIEPEIQEIKDITVNWLIERI